MAIDNEEVIKYTNEILRPLSEEIRDLKYKIDNAIVEWNNTISANVPNNSAEILLDGRNEDGVTVINGEDINNSVTRFIALQTQMSGVSNMNVIEKPCVRAYRG
jgi:hypothetical protein